MTKEQFETIWIDPRYYGKSPEMIELLKPWYKVQDEAIKPLINLMLFGIEENG